MAEAIRMPLLSDTMKEGVIAEWHKKVGDTVKADDVIAEVETDKATMEVMPYVAGTLLYIGVEKGKGVPVNGIMAVIGKPGEDFSDIIGAAPAATAPAAAPTPVAATPVAVPAPVSAPVAPAPAEVADVHADGRVKASPLAKRLAEDKGVDIHAIKGSGDGGRIVKRDIDGYVPVAVPVAAVPSFAAAPVAAGEAYTDVPLTQMRRIIAQRLSESMFSAPHFYLRITVNMDNAMAARKAVNDFSGTKVSFNDFIIKACAMALRKHPAVNSSWMGDFIRTNHHINIGTAVAVDEGLIVPVVRHADQKSLVQIAGEASSLIDKARTKKIQPHEFTGNTFTISNLGMMDIDEFTAIINPPDACILAVGKIAPTAVAEGNAVVIRQQLKLTLSCDHRVVDGAKGAAFLQTLKAHLENPITMLA
jgi:pyruvate dehydrogenase E2 component (dihydrolipoamide acetyltransferase)